MQPVTYRVVTPTRVVDELRAIHAYVAREAPGAASTVVARLLATIDSLSEFPYGHPVYEARRDPNMTVRRVVERPYLIFYRIREAYKEVVLVSVRHGRRRQRKRFR